MSETTRTEATLSGVVAFKAGLLFAMPFNKHGFKALMKTLLFYGGGYVALFWLWLFLAPREADGLIPLSLPFGNDSMPVATLVFYLVAIVPFSLFYPVRCVLTGRRDHPYFKDVGTPLFTRAVCVELLVLPIHIIYYAFLSQAPWYARCAWYLVFFTLATYLSLVVVHLTATGEVAFIRVWHHFRVTPFKYILSAVGATYVLVIPALFISLLAACFLFGLSGFLAGVDLVALNLAVESFLKNEPIVVQMLPYTAILVAPLICWFGLFVWTCVGGSAALAYLWRGVLENERP